MGLRTMVFLACACLCACAAKTDDGGNFARGKYVHSVAKARSERLAEHPHEFSEEEIEAIKSRMRERELERFPLDRGD